MLQRTVALLQTGHLVLVLLREELLVLEDLVHHPRVVLRLLNMEDVFDDLSASLELTAKPLEMRLLQSACSNLLGSDLADESQGKFRRRLE